MEIVIEAGSVRMEAELFDSPTAQQVWERIGMPGQVSDQRLPDAAAWGGYPAGAPVTKGDALFPRLS